MRVLSKDARRDRSTANLPGRDVAATAAFPAALGIAPASRKDGCMIPNRGPLKVKPVPAPVPHASACVQVNDLDCMPAPWRDAGPSTDPRQIPRLTGIVKHPGVPRMCAVANPDGCLLRVLENAVA